MTSLPRLDSFAYLNPDNYVAVVPPPPPPPEEVKISESEVDEVKDKDKAATNPGEIMVDAAVPIGQMDSGIAADVLLAFSGRDNPYEMKLRGRNVLRHSSALQALIKNEKPDKTNTENLRQRFKGLSLNNQVKEFLSLQLLTPQQLQWRRQVTFDLVMILRQIIPSRELSTFGSFRTGLADASSEIDFRVNLKGDENGRTSEAEIYELQHTAKRIIKTAECPHNPEKRFAADLKLIEGGAPSIRFRHIQTDVTVNLSFGNRVPVRNSRLIGFFMEFDPRVKPLLVLIRSLANFHKISGSKKINKYALSLMALVYLIEKKIIPSVDQLQTLAAVEWPPGLEVDGWDCSFSTNDEMIDNSFEECPLPENYEDVKGQVLLEMLQEFLEMMVTTEFGTIVVCPLVGEMIPRKNLYRLDLAKITLPEKLKDFRFLYSSERAICDAMKIFSPMVIQDPFALDCNVAKLVSQETLESFLEACGNTEEFEGGANINFGFISKCMLIGIDVD